MYAREHRVLLRHYLEQGLSKTAIARTLHVSRRTVYHWIDTGQLDRELEDGPVQHAPRPPVVRKIDSYRQIIQARLTEYPRLSATRLCGEIRAAGYAGGYTQVKEYGSTSGRCDPAQLPIRWCASRRHRANNGKLPIIRLGLNRFAVVVSLVPPSGQ